jgi:hypothetical protein
MDLPHCVGNLSLEFRRCRQSGRAYAASNRLCCSATPGRRTGATSRCGRRASPTFSAGLYKRRAPPSALVPLGVPSSSGRHLQICPPTRNPTASSKLILPPRSRHHPRLRPSLSPTQPDGRLIVDEHLEVFVVEGPLRRSKPSPIVKRRTFAGVCWISFAKRHYSRGTSFG